MNIIRIPLLLFFVLACAAVWAQPTYFMGNRVVSDCEGFLEDSNVGNEDFPNGYDHNENYTFTVCVPGAPSVTIDFLEFKLETTSSQGLQLDILTIYAGPDRNSPVIGEFTGDQNPGSFTVDRECVTFHFVSDASVNGEGWRLKWTFVPPPPEEPEIQPIPNPTCGTESIVINFEDGISCSQVTNNNFGMTAGSPTGGVANVTPLNCVNDTTTSVQVDFTGPLDRSGIYGVTYNIVYFDICGNPYQYSDTAQFSIIDCPLEVEIIGDTAVCIGQCTTLRAEVEGGDFNNYQFTWDPAGPNSPNYTIRPTEETVVTVTVTDGNSIPASATRTVTLKTLPTAPDDFSMCRFSGDTNLTATPAGGSWGGDRMNNGGRFRPNNDGVNKVYYVGPNGCADTTNITVFPVNSPGRVPICLGSDPVQIDGTPAGGTWSGDPNISAGGLFDPQQEGSFTVTYTEPNNGCQKDTRVDVVDEIDAPAYDSIIKCSNEPPFDLEYAPRGGRWTGPGVNNNGRFNPGNAGPGFHKLYYTINGGDCTDSTSVEVFTIGAGNDTLLCPTSDAFPLTTGVPSGGIWSGPGVTANADSTVYTFNAPFFMEQDTVVTLNYELQGCVDQKIMYLITTQAEDISFQFCEYDSIGVIRTNTINTNPDFGNWYGPSFNDDTLTIENQLGVGTHYIYYEVQNNGCVDSVAININLKPDVSVPVDRDTVCPRELDFDLTGTPAGGVWTGIGITDDQVGTFSPTSIGFQGTFEPVYTLDGCTDTATIVVRTPQLNITGLGEKYCFQYNAPVNISGTPGPGYFEGPGITDPTAATFDRAAPDAGTGEHTITYVFGDNDIYGSEECIYRESIIVEISDTLEIDSIVGDSPICPGERTILSAYVVGGRGPGSYKLDWTPEDFGGTSPYNITVRPDASISDTTINYELTVTDRGGANFCAPDSYVFPLTIHPQVMYDAIPGPTVCFGLDNYINLYNVGTNPLRYDWLIDGDTVTTDSLFIQAGLYDLVVTDEVTGCAIETREEIPQYPYLEANIVTVPNVPCVDILDPNIFIVNSSVGATAGSWTIGDIDTTEVIPFTPGGNFEYQFPDTGDYTIDLSISNGNGQCSEQLSIDMCVNKIVTVFIPNTFTPNNDGDNDVWPTGEINVFGNLTPEGYDLIDFEFTIHDRWGKQVFFSEDFPNEPWDGNFRNRQGEPCKPGVYSYRAKLFFDEFNHQDVSGTITLLR